VVEQVATEIVGTAAFPQLLSALCLTIVSTPAHSDGILLVMQNMSIIQQTEYIEVTDHALANFSSNIHIPHMSLEIVCWPCVGYYAWIQG